MKEKEIFNTNYTKTEIKPHSKKTYKNPEKKHLKKYKQIKEISFPSTSINICCCKGENSKNIVSIFGSNEISIYDTLTDTEISKFNNVVFEKISNGIIRSDGKLVLTGDDTGKILIHEIITMISLINSCN